MRIGSSRGRGTRAAGWFDDLIQEKGGEEGMESLILGGGIKGWATAGKEYQEFMVGYEGAVWEA
jgi:arsenical-resistance protein 2